MATSIKNKMMSAPMGKCRIIGWNLPKKNKNVLSTFPSKGMSNRINNRIVNTAAILVLRLFMNLWTNLLVWLNSLKL